MLFPKADEELPGLLVDYFPGPKINDLKASAK
jgi:hypothetical protein